MSENAMIPRTEASAASEKQKALLIKMGKWTEGMSYEEASDMIESLPKMDYPKPGVWPMKVRSIEIAKKKDGSQLFDKNGNPALAITFAVRQGATKEDVKEITGNFWYKKDKNTECKAQFRLASLKRALGVADDSQAGIKEIENTVVWGAIRKVLLTDAGGTVLKHNDGAERTFVEIMGNFYKYDKNVANNGKPNLEGDPSDGVTEIGGKFIDSQVSRTEGHAPAQKTTPMQDDFEGDSTVKPTDSPIAPTKENWED